jgi:hypothetical protein
MEEPQALSSGGGDSGLVAGPRLYELLVEARHPSMVVSVLFSDLEESPSRHLATQAIELLQHAEHHPRPAFTGPTFLPEIDPRTSRLVGGCAQQSLDPLEPPLGVEQLDLPNVVAFDHRADSRT